MFRHTIAWLHSRAFFLCLLEFGPKLSLVWFQHLVPHDMLLNRDIKSPLLSPCLWSRSFCDDVSMLKAVRWFCRPDSISPARCSAIEQLYQVGTYKHCLLSGLMRPPVHFTISKAEPTTSLFGTVILLFGRCGSCASWRMCATPSCGRPAQSEASVTLRFVCWL